MTCPVSSDSRSLSAPPLVLVQRPSRGGGATGGNTQTSRTAAAPPVSFAAVSSLAVDGRPGSWNKCCPSCSSLVHFPGCVAHQARHRGMSRCEMRSRNAVSRWRSLPSCTGRLPVCACAPRLLFAMQQLFCNATIAPMSAGTGQPSPSSAGGRFFRSKRILSNISATPTSGDRLRSRIFVCVTSTPQRQSPLAPSGCLAAARACAGGKPRSKSTVRMIAPIPLDILDEIHRNDRSHAFRGSTQNRVHNKFRA